MFIKRIDIHTIMFQDQEKGDDYHAAPLTGELLDHMITYALSRNCPSQREEKAGMINKMKNFSSQQSGMCNYTMSPVLIKYD